MDDHTTDYTEFSNEELAQAVRLLVRPDLLGDRAVLIGILRALDYTPDIVREHLRQNKPNHDGPPLAI